MKNLTGQIVAGRYRIDEFIGRGGMAEVYKVWDQKRSTFLALKMLTEDLALDRVFIRRFRREAQTLARLQHPNVVRFYGLEQESRLAFMLLDYVDGETLKHKIFDAQGPMAAKDIRKVCRAICSALQFSHGEGLIHCDIKPANVMINKQGDVLLSDFGIARMTDTATATMVGMGTPAYMAPEQVKGLNPVPQTDIYALGIVLFEMLTGGERPFIGDQAPITGTSSELVRWEQVNMEPKLPGHYNKNMSEELDKVVEKSLQKNPEDRYQTPLDFFNSLEIALNVTDLTPVSELEGLGTIDAEEPEEDHPDEQNESAVFPQLAWWNQWKVWIGAGGVLLILLAFMLFGNTGFSPFSAAKTTPAFTRVSPTNTLAQTSTPTLTKTSLPLTDTPVPTNTPAPTDTPAPTNTPVPRIGSTFVSPIDEKIMVYVPAGDFKMGSIPSQYDEDDEKPVHTVTLNAYWIDKTEVTTTQYAKFLSENTMGYVWDMAGKPQALIEQRNGKWQAKAGYEDHPMIYVTWDAAQSYCEWAEKRLPTEAEWEKAAGGGSTHNLWPWGNEWDCYRTNAGPCDEYTRTAPVGSFPNGASPYGALDMAGNVWEWVQDWYGSDSYNYPGSPPNGENRVVRGGSYLDDRSGVRTTDRDELGPGYATGQAGFRCVMDLP